MQCPSCNGFRPADNAPCPLCSAPSPLVTEAWNGQNSSFPGNQNQANWGGSSVQNQAAWGGSGVQNQANWGGSGVQNQAAWGGSGVQNQANWGGSGVQNQAAWGGSGATQNDWSGSPSGQMAFPSPPNFGGSGAQQMSFPAGQQTFAQPSDGSDNSFWAQNMATRDTRGSGQQQSLLPVPFQPQPGSNGQALSMLPTAFPTISPGIPQVHSLVPALPESDQEAPVYVAPMYTKPRPIIPRYRAISGLISVIIVVSLLCGGASYYAQVTGKLAFIEKLFGTYSPPARASNQQMLKIPSSQVMQGPGANVVYSVGISNKVDRTTGIIPAQINQFTVGDTIWLVCSSNPPKDGALTIKWYSNGNLYKTATQQIPKAKNQQTRTSVIPIIYGLPTEGKAEVYWNDQLAATVLFVVQPAAT